MPEIPPYEVLRRPVVTEKDAFLKQWDKYTFEVARDANKVQIQQAVEMAFNVHVKAVNVMTVPGKMRRRGRWRGMTSPWKKAIVTLQSGDKIELFEGT